ncbi:hypothetical protein DAETH_38750 (plasmid) [Deinococcus aetherius]|uniref:histidine kinase n=1 Tax=Deinococcus aetherius TaxID=200252 RepID=A0ABN6RKT6_9DEIO|nr:sensor histidine kinase [Deinococcus aetherius]BDP43906.1 hypothetical protein DAETH_38750 [Deinococcus aetherius]
MIRKALIPPRDALGASDTLLAAFFLVAYLLMLGEPVAGEGRRLTVAGLGAAYLTLAVVAFPRLRRRGPWWVLGYTHVQAALGAVLTVVSGAGAGALGTWSGLTLLILLMVSQAARAQPLSWSLVYCAGLPLYYLGTRWDDALRLGGALFASGLFVVLTTHAAVQEGRRRAEQEARAAQLEQVNRALRASAAQAEELAATRERNRIARDIHDGLGHHLTALHVQLQAAQAVLPGDPARAGHALEQARGLTQGALADVRRSVGTLRDAPPALPDALALLAQEAHGAGVEVALRVHGARRPLGSDAEQALYRVAQEGVTNVRKHAHASRAELTLEYHPGSVTLTICDEGVGARAPGGGFGLPGARERVALLGGELRVDSAPGRGLTLSATVPR